jgi:hypothetical protein
MLLKPQRHVFFSCRFCSCLYRLLLSRSRPACGAAPVQPTLCGVYTDSCRGGSPTTGGIDFDNLARQISLLGDQYGQISWILNVHLGPDTSCGPESLLASINATGTFALQGPSDCGGQCPVCVCVSRFVCVCVCVCVCV